MVVPGLLLWASRSQVRLCWAARSLADTRGLLQKVFRLAGSLQHDGVAGAGDWAG